MEQGSIKSPLTSKETQQQDGSKNRRYSTGKLDSSKNGRSPNYLRASTGSCHDFCKYGKNHIFHEKAESPILKSGIAPKNTIQNSLQNLILAERKKAAVSKFKSSPESKILLPGNPKFFSHKVSPPSRKVVCLKLAPVNSSEIENPFKSAISTKPKPMKSTLSSEADTTKELRTYKKKGTSQIQKKTSAPPIVSLTPKISLNRILGTEKQKGVKVGSHLKNQNTISRSGSKPSNKDKDRGNTSLNAVSLKSSLSGGASSNPRKTRVKIAAPLKNSKLMGTIKSKKLYEDKDKETSQVLMNVEVPLKSQISKAKTTNTIRGHISTQYNNVEPIVNGKKSLQKSNMKHMNAINWQNSDHGNLKPMNDINSENTSQNSNVDCMIAINWQNPDQNSNVEPMIFINGQNPDQNSNVETVIVIDGRNPDQSSYVEPIDGQNDDKNSYIEHMIDINVQNPDQNNNVESMIVINEQNLNQNNNVEPMNLINRQNTDQIRNVEPIAFNGKNLHQNINVESMIVINGQVPHHNSNVEPMITIYDQNPVERSDVDPMISSNGQNLRQDSNVEPLDAIINLQNPTQSNNVQPVSPIRGQNPSQNQKTHGKPMNAINVQNPCQNQNSDIETLNSINVQKPSQTQNLNAELMDTIDVQNTMHAIEMDTKEQAVEISENENPLARSSPSISSSLKSSSYQSSPSSSHDGEKLQDSEYTSETDEYTSEDETTYLGIKGTSKLESSVVLRKTRVILSEKDCTPTKLKFRRGKIIDVQSENNNSRRLRFRQARLLEKSQNVEDDSRRRRYKKREIIDGHASNSSSERVVLRHQDLQGKKDSQGLFNNVIKETASKLAETRKSKVKALVGAFETVISLQDNHSSVGADL